MTVKKIWNITYHPDPQKVSYDDNIEWAEEHECKRITSKIVILKFKEDKKAVNRDYSYRIIFNGITNRNAKIFINNYPNVELFADRGWYNVYITNDLEQALDWIETTKLHLS